MVAQVYAAAFAALALRVGALPNAALVARTGLDMALPAATPMPAITDNKPATNAWLDDNASPPWGAKIQPIFAVQGGGDQAADDACGLVVQSAKVMVADMTASMRSASQTAWVAAAPTFSMALGGPNRDHSDWVQCLHKRSTQEGRPWGNGVVPMIDLDPGIPTRDKDTCSRNSKLLTSMWSHWVKSVSSKRKDKKFDTKTPTWGVIGGACVTERYKGPADKFWIVTEGRDGGARPTSWVSPKSTSRVPPREPRPSRDDDDDDPRGSPASNPWAQPPPPSPQQSWQPRPAREPEPVTVTVWTD